MSDFPVHACLEPEVLAAYADHGLSLTERARVETHLAACPRCTAVLAGAIRTVAAIAPATHEHGTEDATPLVSRRSVLGMAAAAAAVLVVLAAPPLLGPRLQRDTGLVNLAGSVGEHRSVLGRLTGGIPHAPLAAPSAGGQGGRAAGTDRVLLTSGRIRGSVGELATPSRLHAAGMAHLLSRRFDAAAELLVAAAREQPNNARYLSDVSAVHLERARLGLRPDDLPRALAAAERATRLDPSLHEAWFNRAMAIGALSLTDQARAAWTEYLKRDSTSPWAGEARQKLEELARPSPAAAWDTIAAQLEQPITAASADAAVRAHTTEARNVIEHELFVEWANAVLAGNTGAAELERVRLMAEAMLRIAGDALYRDAVNAIDRADATGRTAVVRLAEAHRHYAEAAALYAEDQHAAAAPRLTAARHQLAAAGSPYQWRAALDFGGAEYFLGDSAAAAPLVEQLASTSRRAGYRYLAGRASWLQGLAAFQQGRLNDARVRYEETVAAFEDMGDAEQRAAAESLLAAWCFFLGDRAEEWRHRTAAMTGLAWTRSPRYRYAILASAAQSMRAEAPESALLMQETALAEARAWRHDAAIADVLAQRASTLLALGREREAEGTIAEARGHLNAVADPAFRRIFALPVLAVEADLLRRSNPRESAAAAMTAIDTARSRRETVRMPPFQLRLARANIAMGRLQDAERALGDGIAAFDATRATPASSFGVSTNDEAWQLFEVAVQLAIHRGDYQRAFAMAEQGRAQIPAAVAQRLPMLTLPEAQALLRPDEAIVALHQFDDELAVWVIRNHGTRIVTRPLRRTDALQMVARHQDEIRFEAAPAASGVLYETVIRPVHAQLEGVTRVSFVPDATYRDISFAALWDRSANRFLVERWTVSAAPSLATLGAARAERPASQPLDSVLVLAAGGDAARVKAIADQYRSAELLAGPSATRSRLLAGAPVMHVAAPSYRSELYPSLSRLVLADETVLSSEIAARALSATRLVVLDEARVQHSYQAAGTFDLATTFLAAGVPAVLGTLPGADESKTRELMVGFHRELVGQASFAAALSRVQRNALQQNGRRLGAWTALVLYGSDR